MLGRYVERIAPRLFAAVLLLAAAPVFATAQAQSMGMQPASTDLTTARTPAGGGAASWPTSGLLVLGLIVVIGAAVRFYKMEAGAAEVLPLEAGVSGAARSRSGSGDASDRRPDG